jgi:hypothetical protein
MTKLIFLLGFVGIKFSSVYSPYYQRLYKEHNKENAERVTDNFALDKVHYEENHGRKSQF